MIEINTENFDPNRYIDELIEAMGLKNEATEKVAALKEKIAIALHNKIFEAASQAVEPEVIDDALEEFQDEKNTWNFILQLLRISPAAQVAMTQAIDEFTEETLAAYEILANKS